MYIEVGINCKCEIIRAGLFLRCEEASGSTWKKVTSNRNSAGIEIKVAWLLS